MQKLIATFAEYPINSQTYWSIPSSLTWKVGVFIDFYHKLNVYYLAPNNLPLIDNKQK